MKRTPISWRGLWLCLMVSLCLLAVPRAEPQTVLPQPQKKNPEMLQLPYQQPRYPQPPNQQPKYQPPTYQPPPPNQVYPKVMPRLEPIAETKLIMEGLAHTNFRGLEKLLTERPTDVKAYQFARGQALLLAETANLLMLRPPKNAGQTAWFDRSMALRNAAKELALAVGERDYERGRAGLLKVTAVCNSCHQTFRIAVEIKPFERPPIEKVSVE